MSNPTLFIIPGACSLGSQVLLEWLKIPYSIGITTPEIRQSNAFRKINPTGKVGALKDGDLVVAENLAILLHLFDKYAASSNMPLIPLGSEVRAKTYQWLSYFSSTLHIAFGQALFAKVSEDILEQYMANAKSKLFDVLGFIDNFLASHDYFVSNKASIVDAQGYGLLRWSRNDKASQLGLKLDNYPNIVNFLQRVEQIPEVQNALAIENKQLDRVANSLFAGYFTFS